MSSASEHIKENDQDAMAKFILDEIPDGDASAAISFLEGVIECIRVTRSIKKQRVSDTSTVVTETTKSAPSKEKDGEKDSAKDGAKDPFTSFYLNDNLDHIIITLGLQFPDDPYLTAYVIGLRGQNVLTIGKKTGTRIKVENEGTRGDDQLRHIFIMGPLKGCIRAYHLLQDHLLQKASTFPLGTTEYTRIIIPNEIVSHIIGKGGRFIKELSTNTKVKRIELQKDRDIYEQYAGYYGRYCQIVGDFPNRLHAVYLLLRHMAQDTDLPGPFFGDILPVQYPAGGPGQGPNDGHGHHDGPDMSFQNRNMGPHGQGMGGHGMMNDHSMQQFGQFNGNGNMNMNMGRDGGNFGRMGPMGGDPNFRGRGFGPQNQGQGGGFPGPGAGAGGEFPTDVDIQVPSDKSCVAYIYGHRGGAIIEMEQVSRCRIVFDKEPLPGSVDEKRVERKVTISGVNMVQIGRAIELISVRVQEWKRTYVPPTGQSVQAGTANVQTGKRDRNDAPVAAANRPGVVGVNGVDQTQAQRFQNYGQNVQQPGQVTYDNTQYAQAVQGQQQIQGAVDAQGMVTGMGMGMGMGQVQGQVGVGVGVGQVQLNQAQLLAQQQYNQAYAAYAQSQAQAQVQAQVQGQGQVQGVGVMQGGVQGQVQGQGQYPQQYPAGQVMGGRGY